MRVKSALVGSVLFLGVAAPGFAQQGVGNGCTPAGVWYGGSVVSYQLTIVPAVPAGEYTVFFEGMYKTSVMNTTYSGRVVKKGDVYEGSIMQLITQDDAFLDPPPIFKMPDLNVAWISIRMPDCNSLTNTIPFFGLYLASGIWDATPGIVWLNTKVPLKDAPDVDLLNILSGGHPVLETYHRLSSTVSPSLLHK
jgi:hypothetical protein